VVTKLSHYHLFSERISHKDYNRKCSVEKNTVRGSQRAWRQEKLIGGKPPVVMTLKPISRVVCSQLMGDRPVEGCRRLSPLVEAWEGEEPPLL
jgi:hypothetical protein